MEIIPSILEKEWKEIETKIEICRSFAKSLHIDFIDGVFHPNKTFLDPGPFSKYSNDFLMEAHLMVENPVSYIDSLYKSGFKRFIGQVEKMPDQVEFVAKGEAFGAVGLGIDINTSLDEISVPFFNLDMILLMSVNIGESGQLFLETVIDKIKKARLKTDIPIEVDGGINAENIGVVKKAGANFFVLTSFIFKGNPQENFNLLREKI